MQMNKLLKIRNILYLIALWVSIFCVFVLPVFLSGCNHKEKNESEKTVIAIIKMPDESTKILNVDKSVFCTGYIRITTTEGIKYWISYENCIIIEQEN